MTALQQLHGGDDVLLAPPRALDSSAAAKLAASDHLATSDLRAALR